MKVFRSILLSCLFSTGLAIYGQAAFDNTRFFTDENPLNATLLTDLGNLISGRIKNDYQEATFTSKLPDSSSISEEIKISARGHTRRSICHIPPLRLNFRNTTSPKLSSLKSLKLVCACRSGPYYQQLLLKEYLIYKMYNLLTEKSFRVRLVNLTYADSKGRKKTATRYDFFLENVDEMAKRNHCKEWYNPKMNNEDANREQLSLLAIFEYMIGNTDWSVRAAHNIKLVIPKKDSTARPFPVPYDFDYAGIVNADYAIPDPKLGIENVTQRLYRGYARNMEELQKALEVYTRQKEKIYALITDFEPLENRVKKEMIYYLDGFYKMISNPAEVEYEFINNARQP